MRTITALILTLAAAPALAAPVCSFTQECYMDVECTYSEYEVTVDREAGQLTTVAETYEILPADLGNPNQIVALGTGSLALLTIGSDASAMTVHIADGPTVLTYFGACTAE